MSDVRTSASGTPAATAFAGTEGTPVVVDSATGDLYVMKTGDVVTKAASVSRMLEVLTSADNQAIGLHNTGVGETPLPSITSGAGNTATGFEALKSVTTSDENTAFGYRALKSITTTDGTTGRHNVAFGSHALEANTTGRQNCAIGNQTLELNTTGINNVAVGNGALDANVSGGSNVAIGIDSQRLATGSNNTSIGVSSMQTSTSGATNSAIGSAALLNNLSGSGNVALGYFAGGYELGSNAFYVDNQDRTNTAGDKAGALLYGGFSGTVASQRLQINAVVTKPVQPCFLATATLTTNVTGDSTVATVTWGTEIFDLHSDFASNTFTAPVAGKYHFDVLISFNGLAIADTLAFATLVATSRSLLLFQINPSGVIAGGELSLSGAADIDMAANDTATVTIRVDGATKVVGYKANSHFSGHLVA